MAITHNYLNTASKKPTAAEASQAELIPNLADGTLWTENTVGTVIRVGGENNNISDANATDLTDGGDTILHGHTSSMISDFQTTVSSNTDVAASKTITDHITVTQAVDLDSIETRVNQLDAAIVLKGLWNATTPGTFPASTLAGESWIVSVAGTVDSIDFNINDRIIALVDTASTTLYTDWHKADYTDEVLSVNTQTGAVVLDADDISDAATTNKFVTAADITTLGNLSGTNSGDQNLFSTLSVSGQTDIVADTTSDTLTMVAGSGIVLTTNAATDEVTITSTASGTTNLTASYTTTTFDVISSSGSDVTIAQAVGGTSAGALSSADKTKLDFITVTAAVDLDTALLIGESV